MMKSKQSKVNLDTKFKNMKNQQVKKKLFYFWILFCDKFKGKSLV